MTRKIGACSMALLCAAALAPASAFAHTGAGHVAGFGHGFAHPLGGLDHILAMVAVGIWASQAGGKSLWAVPATFVGVMLLGGVLGAAGVTLPYIEEGIIVSVLMLGVLIALAARLPMALSMAVVGLFALFHGHAHGAEMPVAASALAYGMGFTLATALLHISGISIGALFQKTARAQSVRYAGAAIAVSGLLLFFV